MSKSANKILSTAEQLFNQHSFVSVGVDLIRDESGCSKTTMYTYFKNKHQLVCEVLKQRDQRFRASLSNYVADQNGMTALDAIFNWHCDWFQSDHFKGCLFVRAVAESTKQDHELIEISKHHKIWLREFIFQHISELKQAQLITEMLFNILEGLISRFLVEGYDESIVQETKKSFNVLVRSLQNQTV